MLRLRPRWLRAGRVAIALLSFPALALAACRDGTDPASTEPQGMVVVAKADTIITMLIDGRAQQRFPGVSSISQYGQHPAWLDYARVLVHTVTSAGGPNVRVHALDLGTRALTRVTPTSSALTAEWYPRSSAGWVLFMGETSAGEFQAWRMRPTGTTLEKIPLDAATLGNIYRPVLSPDGSRLAVSTVVGGTAGVIVLDAATGAATSPWVPNATTPRWSPDGRRVAFSTPRGGAIRVMAASGSGLRTITGGPYDEWFDWSADGNWVVAVDDTGLTLVRVSNGETRPIANTAGMWQPAVTRVPTIH